ncbi:MAG: BatA domain-containing protein [Ignavibacteriae bacterium]|nr:BatA domain-containing protein [Ignavibacteriota bacterium]
MTFLNPLLLFGLIASAIPIIIHLLNLRKLKTIEFSTLRFLKELQKTKMRRVQIRQWLLLALRTLLIIAVVLAFSRPALRGSLAGFPLGGSTHAKTTLVILLDDSPSTSVRNERGPLFTQAKEMASRILDLMKEGDEAYFVTLSEMRHAKSFTASHAAAPVQQTLQQLNPSQLTAPYRDALGVAAKILAESKNFNQEIYLITDKQATQFLDPKPSTDTTDLFDDNVKLFLADVSTGNTTRLDNAGIASAEIKSTIITQNKPFTLQARITNAGSSALRNAVVSAYLDGARVGQQSIDIPSQNSGTVLLTITPKRRGMLQGYLQIEDDALEFDNTRHFAVEAPASLRVLAVGASQADTRLPALALTLDKDSASGGLFRVEQADENRLSSFDLKKYDILLLVGVKIFSTGDADRIAQFVNAGGGLLMFAGREMDVANYNTVLFPKLGIPAAQQARLSGAITSYPPPQQGSFISFSKIDFQHPLFAELFEQQTGKKSQPEIESPKVYTSIAPQPGARGRSIISLSDGTSFLTEYQFGAGRVLLFSVEAGLTWSDFPLKGIFVPLLYRSGLYLSQKPPMQSITVGDELSVGLRIPNRSEKEAYVLRSPSGVDERIIPQFSRSGLAAFSSHNATESGVYQIRTSSGKDGDLLYAVPVNISSYETHLQTISDADEAMFFARLGLKAEQIRTLPTGASIEADVLETRYGVELWKHFVGLALLLALVEMIVGRERKSEQRV